jgi:hypothetical protein
MSLFEVEQFTMTTDYAMRVWTYIITIQQHFLDVSGLLAVAISSFRNGVLKVLLLKRETSILLPILSTFRESRDCLYGLGFIVNIYEGVAVFEIRSGLEASQYIKMTVKDRGPHLQEVRGISH